MVKIVIGNWKMNPTSSVDVAQLVKNLVDHVPALNPDVIKVYVAPPSIYINQVAHANDGSHIQIAAQNCAQTTQETGAFTGQVSAAMLRDMDVQAIIVGHSERREAGEDKDVIRAQVIAAAQAGLTAVLCVGEDLYAREQGTDTAIKTVCAQIDEILAAHEVTTALLSSTAETPFVLAYEPIWAIGTGKTADIEDIETMHAALEDKISKYGFGDVAILYGGSVKPSNAEEILSARGVGGVLVGGASLKAQDFVAIIEAAL